MFKRIRASRGWTKAFAGVAVGALAAGAVVHAQTTDGTIHGCVELSSHNLQIDSAPNIQSQGGCVPGVSVELVWRNADTSGQGPAGPQGPAGAQGPKGDRGDAGATGAGSGLRTIHRTIGPSVVATKQGSARCDNGQHVVTGGYTLTGDAKVVLVKASRPSGTTAWFVRARQTSSSADWSLVVYALCAT